MKRTCKSRRKMYRRTRSAPNDVSRPLRGLASVKTGSEGHERLPHSLAWGYENTVGGVKTETPAKVGRADL